MTSGNNKAKAAKHIAIYSVGTIIRQLAGFVMLPIYTTYLTPADYGVIGLLVVMVSLFELLIGARFSQSVPKFYYETNESIERKTVVTTALFITAGISLLSTGLIVVWSSPISSILFGSADFSIYVSLYCIVLFSSAIETYGLTFLRLQERPILFIANSIGKLILQLSLNILLVVHYEMGVMGVVISGLASSMTFAAISAIYILYYTGFHFSRSLSIRLFRFSWPLWVAGLAALYIGSSNRYFIRLFSDLDQVGLFELAVKFSAILSMLVWNPFSQWWQTERFKLYQRPDRGVTVFPVVFNGMASVMVLIAAGISLFSGPVIMLMSAEAFHAAVLAVPVLVYAALINDMSFFFFFSFLATEKTIMITYIKYVSAAIITICYFLLIPDYGFVGAAYALAVANTAIFLLAYIMSKRCFDNGILLKHFSVLIVLFVTVVVIDHILTSQVTSLIVLLSIKVALMLLMIMAVIASIKADEKLSALYSSALSWIRKGVAERIH